MTREECKKELGKQDTEVSSFERLLPQICFMFWGFFLVKKLSLLQRGVPQLYYILCKHLISFGFWTYCSVEKVCQNLSKISFFVVLLCHQPGFLWIFIRLCAKSVVAWEPILFDLFENSQCERKKWIAVETE